MITIMPADKAFLQEIHAPAGADAMVFRDENGIVSGHALFRMDGDTVEILSAECPLPMMTEALIRSVLNTGDCRGAMWGFCRNEALAPLLPRMEFKPTDDGWRVSIPEFFHAPCAGETK